MKPGILWTTAMRDRVRELVAERKSATTIAEHISAEFRTVTRSAVIGFCWRNKIYLRGRYTGRPGVLTEEDIERLRELAAAGLSGVDIARTIGKLSRGGIQHACKKHGIKQRGRPGRPKTIDNP
jgi:hypothetical protein